MSIDFFKKGCQNSSSLSRFGLCDDESEPLKPAYIDEVNVSNWLAEVNNVKCYPVDFYAIDNCVEILRADGTQESRCDGILHYENKLFFVELKDRTSRGWTIKGREQLTATYIVFKSNYDVSTFANIEGYVCNKQRPLANTNHMIQIQRFYSDTGLKLNIQKIIDL
jgi:hypothetical protein